MATKLVKQFHVVIHGNAAPQGSKTKTKWGVREANPRTAPWRAQVSQKAGEVWGDQPLLDGPLALKVQFCRVRPKGHFLSDGIRLNKKGSTTPYPTTPPDLSKLTRAIEDGLTGVVTKDDSRFVYLNVRKVWSETNKAIITVYSVETEVTGEGAK